MLKFADKHPTTAAAMKRAMSVLLTDESDCVFANVDSFDDVCEDLEAGRPVIFYGMESALSLRIEGHAAAPWFYSKTAAYFEVPFELVSMILMYQKIIEGKKMENRAVILAAQFASKQRLVSVLLHDIYPGKSCCERGLKEAEREFGIIGTIENVRAQLEHLMICHWQSSSGSTAFILLGSGRLLMISWCNHLSCL